MLISHHALWNVCSKKQSEANCFHESKAELLDQIDKAEVSYCVYFVLLYFWELGKILIQVYILMFTRTETI